MTCLTLSGIRWANSMGIVSIKDVMLKWSFSMFSGNRIVCQAVYNAYAVMRAAVFKGACSEHLFIGHFTNAVIIIMNIH